MLLITGASGQLGQRVIHHLVETLKVDPSRLVAATRSPDKLQHWQAKGIEVRRLDFDDPTTFPAAFLRIDRALVISTDVIDQPGRRFRQQKAAIDGMVAAGVKHVVLTSMPNPKESLVLFSIDDANTEDALIASNLAGWTILRNHWYFENLFLTSPSALATGTWWSADGNGASADISRDDLALGAATALAHKGSGQNVYTLSGPQALTRAEVAQKLSETVGKPIEVAPAPLEAIVSGMISAGFPKSIAEAYASLTETNTAAGKVQTVTKDFQNLTGRAPVTFDEWLKNHRDVFISMAA
uniref:NAD(P)-binding domain-containing protein n=1 Tax=Compsopogon caeruleus TaxID=31354 RepID=A0A7S1TB28_9RHOD|mmetsp:Transcript_14435/g.29522  ORF Transcript_14435/g.29522 Transcript_14435/m.29522 type:complete len:298 (+) Transcript_14435:257-1150(+)|eukprot:CAMPEP_0184688006 /NCGR_PEP_ID=MMETSP0312-20130426/28248_1 /TAXON_ID=31354 /ORGANISM="Compsopogon coeruleus, Strain SAG 36.94" /LENGTH=297 /DNA_ID=CAMNT_0027144689 /DNA_START=253 /DNA_END=1142 /DNA_ORIENTATION=-